MDLHIFTKELSLTLNCCGSLLYSNSWKVKTDATKNSQAIIYQNKKHLINNVTFNIYSLVISNKWAQVNFMLTCLGNRADVDLKTIQPCYKALSHINYISLFIN